jgi:hypothetical protein
MDHVVKNVVEFRDFRDLVVIEPTHEDGSAVARTWSWEGSVESR